MVAVAVVNAPTQALSLVRTKAHHLKELLKAGIGTVLVLVLVDT